MITTSMLLLAGLLASRMRRVRAFKLVRSRPAWHGLLRCELRRRTLMKAGAPGAYPTPREERLRVWTIGRIPVHASRLSIGLPTWLDARINEVDASEFDGCFQPEFRVSSMAR